jgi:hypothetical protein
MVKVRAKLPNPAGELRPGMFAEVAVDEGVNDEVVVLPESAITYSPYGNSVFVIEQRDGVLKVTRRAVTTHNSWTHNDEAFVGSDRNTNHLYLHPDDAAKLVAVGDTKPNESLAAVDVAAAAGHQLNVVDGRAGRDAIERQRVADFGCSLRTGGNFHPNLQAVWSENVGLLAVRVLQQCDTRGAVRIVFDRDDVGDHAVFAAFEVDEAQLALVSAADVTAGQAALVVAAAGALACADEALLRLLLGDLLERREGLEARGRRERTESFECHGVWCG